MKSYIPVTFFFMAVAFYEMSGGKDFTPAVALAEPTLPAPVEVVTRAETSTVALLAQEPLITPTEETATEIAVVVPADVAATPEPELVEVAVVEPEPIDLRTVTGQVVNMREGPGKSYAVIDQLGRGDTVEVLEASDNGWVRLRQPETGLEGWMSASLLASIDT